MKRTRSIMTPVFVLFACAASNESHRIEPKPLRELFENGDFVGVVYATRLEAGDRGEGSAELRTWRTFKGASSSIHFAWAADDYWSPRPRMLGHFYLALLKSNVPVTVDAGLLELEYMTVDAVAGVTDHCRKAGASAMTCEVIKVHGIAQRGVVFDAAMVHRVRAYSFEATGVTTLVETDVVLLDDLERAFCTWTACPAQPAHEPPDFHPVDVPDIDPGMRKG